jgi:hypothetical protein
LIKIDRFRKRKFNYRIQDKTQHKIMDNNISFLDYLADKKISATSFRQFEPVLFLEWQTLFEQVNYKSFEMQKKFLLNKIRIKYGLE